MENQTLSKEEIERRVRKIVSNYLQVAPEQVKLSSHLVDDLGADSLDLTELAVAFEDEFQVEIPDSEFAKMMTISGVVEAVKVRVG
ncbi:acyl carrier protein [Alicyclobacillus tolerans]|uniref:acyl carrier protein n=1 Tax=Alicyclobacillus tolerans TaxID=90970 RepID=UPI001F018CA8|nr:acyl carrier protein [Alicyclobacillus tolerans]MCF8566559.1 acyl carrier protein [Alicyclobacillus tolerans]